MDDPQPDHIDTPEAYRDHPGPMVVVKYYGTGYAYRGRLRIPKGATWFDHEGKRYFRRDGFEDLYDEAVALDDEPADAEAETVPLEAKAFLDDPTHDEGRHTAPPLRLGAEVDPLERDLEAVRARFTFQPPKPEDRDAYEVITKRTRELAELIVRNVPAGRERSSALTCLSMARMHANAGIALAGTKGA